jgi:hypothetical protein
LALPRFQAWSEEDAPLRLIERTAPAEDPDPQALACYGLLRTDTQGLLLRFVAGRPVSQVTEDFLAWTCARLAEEGKRALRVVWDHASWHASLRVRRWIREHNRRVKQQGGVRIVACFLPVKSPWLNPIEPKWKHGKKAIVEPDRLLSAAELVTRVCQYYGCEQLEPLKQLSA